MLFYYGKKNNIMVQEPSYLEMENASIVVSEALVWWNNSVPKGFIQSQTGNGSQEPAITC